jgi:RND family efflux transporter MFP subunit
VTGTNSSVPEGCRKQTACPTAKEQLDAAQKLMTAVSTCSNRARCPQDLDQAAVALAQAKPQYELAKRHLDALNAVVHQQELKGLQGQLSSAKGKYQGAAAQLSYSEIRSPLNGVVTDRPLYPGEMAAAGTPLVTVMDISRVTARAHIPQSEALLLKVGDPATITIPGQEETVEGKVTLVSPALDPNSTTVEVWVEAKNPKQTLRPGSSVRLSVVSQAVPDALVVPASALLTGPDGATTVMVIADDQHAHQQAVKAGIRQDDKLQITEGLKEGQRIVTDGAYGLPDNAKVTVEAPAEAEKAGDKPTAGKESDSKDSTKDEK